MNAKTLAHEWAHQVKPRGRASALSYEGPVIRSYQTAIGRILAPGVYLVNVAGFSSTTNKHLSYVRRAIPGSATVLEVNDGNRGTRLEPSGAIVVSYSEGMADEEEKAGDKARTRKAEHYSRALRHLQVAQDAARFYKLKSARHDGDRWTKLSTLGGVDAVTAEREVFWAGRSERQRKVAANREAAAAEKLAQWLNGEPVSVPHLTHARFRPWKNSDGMPTHVVESSMGALVPLEDFTRALRFALARRGKEWRANGETCPVGNYSLSSITPEGVVAGCHRVTWAEVDRLAAILL